MFAYTLMLITIMSRAGTPSADAFMIPNYGPPLPGWPSANTQFSSQFYMPNFPIPPMPPMPQMPRIELPNVQQILNHVKKPGTKFQSYIITQNNGESTVLTNTDGDIQAFLINKSSNNDQDDIQFTSIPVPKSGSDSFSGFSTSSFSSSSDNNGKKSQTGGTIVTSNNNGDVKHQSTLYDSRDDE